MANYLIISLLYFTLALLVISASGRALENTNAQPVKVRVVSRATKYTGKTNSSDVLGLQEIIDAFPILFEDNPDPCLPPQWSWIECNSDAQPRIIALDLYNKGLIAYTVPDFSSMDALQRIDLHRNSFYGVIPPFLGTFPDLQELNLAYNLFNGYLPDSIACNKKLKLRVDGNYALLDSVKCPITTSTSSTDVPSNGIPVSGVDGDTTTMVYRRKKSKTPVVLGSSISLFLVVSIAVGIFAIFRHKAKTAEAIAAASAASTQKPSNMPTEEVPMNSQPTNMSPQPQY